jgi:hypothetical protein
VNTVNLVTDLPPVDHAFRLRLGIERLRTQAPAVFAEGPFSNVNPGYRFLLTGDLVAALAILAARFRI